MIIRDLEHSTLAPLTDEESKAVAGGILIAFAAIPTIAIGAGIAEQAVQESGVPIPPGKTFADVFNAGTAFLNPFDGNLFG